MRRRPRTKYTETQKALMWERWKKGETLHQTALKKELLEHLRRTRGMRRSRHHTQKTDVHGKIADAISISERPAAVEDRAVPGHREGDLFFGSGNSQIATLVERQTHYVMLVEVGGECAGAPRSQAAPGALQVPHLGPRQGARGPQALYASNRHPRVHSVILRAHGSAAPTRTPMGCSDSTYPKA